MKRRQIGRRALTLIICFLQVADFGINFLDALIKLGEMELAKGAFRTQLQLFKHLQPERVGDRFVDRIKTPLASSVQSL